MICEEVIAASSVLYLLRCINANCIMISEQSLADVTKYSIQKQFGKLSGKPTLWNQLFCIVFGRKLAILVTLLSLLEFSDYCYNLNSRQNK